MFLFAAFTGSWSFLHITPTFVSVIPFPAVDPDAPDSLAGPFGIIRFYLANPGPPLHFKMIDLTLSSKPPLSYKVIDTLFLGIQMHAALRDYYLTSCKRCREHIFPLKGSREDWK